MKQGSIDGQLVRTLLRLCNLATLVALMLFAAGFFGIPFTPVIAGLGIGGLAIALAGDHGCIDLLDEHFLQLLHLLPLVFQMFLLLEHK